MRPLVLAGVAALFLAMQIAPAHAGLPDQDVRVEIRDSRASSSRVSARVESRLEALSSDELRLQLGVTSWEPRDFRTASRVPDSSAFRRSEAPSLSLGVLLPWLGRGQSVPVSFRTGLGFTELRRIGFVTANGLVQSADQGFYWIPLTIGIEAAPEIFHWKLIGIRAGLALQPTVGFSERSAFDDGRSLWGVPFETTLSLISDLRWVDSAWAGIEVSVEGRATAGRLGGVSAQGSGVGAGLRLSI